MSETYDVVIVGGGIAGGALAAVLARSGIAVAVLERDPVPLDRVRGEFMAPWGVAELKRLGLLETLAEAGGVFTKRSIPYDENTPAIRRFLSPSTSRPFCPTCPARSA